MACGVFQEGKQGAVGACGMLYVAWGVWGVSADPQEQGEDGLECAEHQEWLREWWIQAWECLPRSSPNSRDLRNSTAATIGYLGWGTTGCLGFWGFLVLDMFIRSQLMPPIKQMPILTDTLDPWLRATVQCSLSSVALVGAGKELWPRDCEAAGGF